jgi:hypothetical protein
MFSPASSGSVRIFRAASWKSSGGSYAGQQGFGLFDRVWLGMDL